MAFIVPALITALVNAVREFIYPAPTDDPILLPVPTAPTLPVPPSGRTPKPPSGTYCAPSVKFDVVQTGTSGIWFYTGVSPESIYDSWGVESFGTATPIGGIDHFQWRVLRNGVPNGHTFGGNLYSSNVFDSVRKFDVTCIDTPYPTPKPDIRYIPVPFPVPIPVPLPPIPVLPILPTAPLAPDGRSLPPVRTPPETRPDLPSTPTKPTSPSNGDLWDFINFLVDRFDREENDLSEVIYRLKRIEDRLIDFENDMECVRKKICTQKSIRKLTLGVLKGDGVIQIPDLGDDNRPIAIQLREVFVPSYYSKIFASIPVINYGTISLLYLGGLAVEETIRFPSSIFSISEVNPSAFNYRFFSAEIRMEASIFYEVSKPETGETADPTARLV